MTVQTRLMPLSDFDARITDRLNVLHEATADAIGRPLSGLQEQIRIIEEVQNDFRAIHRDRVLDPANSADAEVITEIYLRLGGSIRHRRADPSLTRNGVYALTTLRGYLTGTGMPDMFIQNL